MNRLLPLFLIIAPIIALGQTTEKSVVAANGERIGFLDSGRPIIQEKNIR
jgi:hypothetical protein